MNMKNPGCDFQWLLDTAEAVDAGLLADIDWEHVSRTLREEARRLAWDARDFCQRAMREQMTRTFVPKEFWPGPEDPGWEEDLAHSLEMSPSLEDQVASGMPEMYLALAQALAEDLGLALDTFPPVCPWSLADLLRGPTGDTGEIAEE